MKKIFIWSIVCFLFANLAFGQKIKGKLSYFSQDGQKFWVVINGKKINSEPAYEVPAFEVDGNWGKARIIFQNSQIPPIDKNWQVTDADSNICSVKYMIKKNKKGKYDISIWDATYEVLGKNGVTTTTNTATNNQNNTTTETNATVVKPNQPAETTTTTTSITTNTTGVNVNTNVNPTGVNMNVNGLGLNINVTDPNLQPTGTSTVTTTSTTNSQGFNNNTNIIAPNPNANKPPTPPTSNTNATNNSGCVNAMSASDFADAKSSINAKPFEDNKMTVAKQIAKVNCLSVAQVKELVMLFSFEDSKLDFAKYAYSRVVDKNNYYKINDAFSFSTSVDELNEYISNQK